MEATDATWTIRSVLKAAWEKQKGAKAKILSAGIVYALACLILELGLREILPTLGIAEFVIQWNNYEFFVKVLMSPLLHGWARFDVVTFLMAPLLFGWLLLGISRSAGTPISIKSIYKPFSLFLILACVNLLIASLTLVGTLLLILPGIYLALSYAFAPVLVIEKNMGVWESMEMSRKTVTIYWWRYLGLTLILVLLNTVAMMVIVPLIWSIPITLIAIGEVYNASFRNHEQLAASLPT